MCIRDSGGGGPGIRDGEDRALLRVSDARTGRGGPAGEGCREQRCLDHLGTGVDDDVADAPDDLADDDAGVAARREQDRPLERVALAHQAGGAEDAGALVDGDHLVDGRVEGEVEVGPGVAGGHGEDVEGVDLGTSGRERRSSQQRPVAGGGGPGQRQRVVTLTASAGARPGGTWGECVTEQRERTQPGLGEPIRDWFPISFTSTFGDWADLVHGAQADFGQLSCGCHPNCGVGTAVMVNKETKEMAPVPQFLNIQGLVTDMQHITDTNRGKWFSNIMMGLALLKHYNAFKAPSEFKLTDLLKKFDKTFNLSGNVPDLPTDQRLKRVQAGEADAALESLYFQFGRYLLMGSSRPGTMAANLQGIWNDRLAPSWELSLIHI